ncbi:MAG TPA: NAD-dependent epimerase/dehydratase family protein [Candidatus Dormibacteraeota bacterium]|nr:NAD-dependent epimerase/dehydratase family protein [Candidatus Dormibacteraeota bacterium]
MARQRHGLVLLTGATGFVGGAVMEQLVEAGYSVRALARRPETFHPGPEVATWPGDILDLDTVVAAARGCDAVIHCAADYRLALRPGEISRMIAVNVGGTGNVLEAATRVGIRRMVHCSTVGTLAFERSGRVCSEVDMARSPGLLPGPYKRSKWAAERLALRPREGGPEVVAVLPSTPVGAGDRRPTPTGQTIRDFLRGRIPAVVDTGLNLVAVEAVARGHLLALERGVPGRAYILGDANLSLREFLGRVAAIAGRPPPRWRVPVAVGLAAAVVSEGVGRVRRRAPVISLTSARMAAHPMYVSSARAWSELGWRPEGLESALRQAVLELGPGARSREA